MTRRSWRSFWFGLAVSLALGSTLHARVSHAQAEKVVCDPDDPEICSQPLQEGETAAFSGQLLTPKLAIQLGQAADSFDVRLELELGRVEDKYKLDLAFQKKVLKLEKAGCKKQTDLLSSRLKDAQLEHWYQHPIFVATISVAATVLVWFGAVYTIKAVK